MKFLVFNKKAIIIFLIIISSLAIVLGISINKNIQTFMPVNNVSVVIDAGHGGIDGGCKGKVTGVCESELNLIDAKNLANQLNAMGIVCSLTRTDNNGLYDKNATNLKKSDMQKRKEIIEKINPTLVLSIHMNSFPLASASGAQVFYKKDSQSGKTLADSIQLQLNKSIKGAKKSSKVGDYYMVNCTNLPAVLIECGYLSNIEEEKLLQNKDYQNKFCYCLCCGIIDFLNK